MSASAIVATESRLFRAQERILQLIAEGTTLHAVLERIATTVDEISREGIASILLLDEDGRHVHHGAAPGLPKDYNDALEGLPIGPTAGACGSALYHGRQVISSDIENDPLWANYASLALAHGLRACWSNPVSDSNGRVVASFALYYRTVRKPDEEDQRLIARVTHLLGIAIEHFRNQHALEAFREQLREGERRLGTLVANLPGMAYRCRNDEHWTMLWVSEGSRDLTGFAPDELIDNRESSFAELILDQEVPGLVEQINAAHDRNEAFDITYRFRHRNGEIRWAWERGQAVQVAGREEPLLEGFISDITALKTQEETLARLNRSLMMMSQCNEALVRAESEQTLLDTICDVVVDTGGYPLAWVALPLAGGDPHFQPRALAQAVDDDAVDRDGLTLDASNPLLRDLFSAHQPIQVASPQRVLPKLSNEGRCEPDWAECYLIPLRKEETLVGIFAVMIREGESIQAQEKALLGELAEDLAFGMLSRRSQESEDRLQKAVLGIASAFEARSGADFFQRLVKRLVEVMGADIGGVARFLPESEPTAKIVAGTLDGEPLDGLVYPLAGTPCESYLSDSSCVIPAAVRARYPDDEFLIQAGAEAYAGQRLDDSSGQPLGLLFVLFREAVPDPEFVTATLGIFAAGAAAEIERMERELRIEEQAALLEQVRDVILLTDHDGRIEYWNRGAEQTYGWSDAEARGRLLTELLDMAPDDFAAARAQLEQAGYWEGDLTQRTRAGEQIVVACHWTQSRFGEAAPLRILQVGSDVTRRKEDEARIHRLAFYDDTTDLPNRVLALEHLQAAIALMGEAGRPGVLLILNLNRFKEINESMGHAAGDQVLIQVANRLRTLADGNVFLARLGGDEFLFLMDGADRAAGVEMAGRIAQALTRPLNLGRQQVQLSASAGLAVYPEDGDAADILLRQADIAMNEARDQGGGWRAFEPAMSLALNEKLSLARDFTRALDAGHLSLHYQPQFDLATGRVCGAEALLRWQDPERGWVSPGRFIPVLEERRMLGQLGPWLFREVANQIAEWRQAGLQLPGPISINLGAQQLENDQIVEEIETAVEEAGISPSDITLELTETGIMQDPERSVSITRRFKQAGYQLAIDDFGTGYSSMNYLKRFPADLLKIDIQFIRDMLDDPSDYAIVQTIITMAHALGMQTLAEGVEMEDQADSLRMLGCECVQGFLYGHPSTAVVFAERWMPRP